MTSFDEQPVAIGGAGGTLRFLRAPLLIAAAGLIFSWPAFYNGYPLVWYDSGGYLIAGWEHAYLPAMRSPFYGLAILPLLAFNSEWPIVIAQAAIAAAMIYLTLRVVWGGLRALPYLLLVGLLALLTTLPWQSSAIMADLPAALLPLCVFLLVFGRDRLAGWEITFVFAVTLISCLVHYSHLPLLAVLSVLALVIALLKRWPRVTILRGLCLCLAAILLTTAAHIAVQLAARGRLAIAPNSTIFLLARLVEDGPAKDFLVAHCGEVKFALCAYVDDMPMSTTHFLWRGDGPVSRIGGFATVASEAETIVGGTLREQPVRIALLSLRHTLEQLVRFGLDGYMRQFSSPGEDWQRYAKIMKNDLPGEYAEFAGSRESTGRLEPWVFSWLTPTVAISAAILGVLALIDLCRRGFFRNDSRLRALFWLVLGTEIANAAICGAFSEPSSRYQSRVVWLLPFLLLVATMPLISARFARRRRLARS